ncbi:serine protease [Alkalihalobacillus sp. MEB130]|uniref:S1C family serine protease n=1 Tax=Alkalihalobacillus sp. MEB130 TaxID=2976704 RepID=UPI0028DE904B|nr:serine protease [Alkalihalobacillus sp. MEB130]MDT8860642.1 serine protease [Alkalihalobacillus sp. MEB130]
MKDDEQHRPEEEEEDYVPKPEDFLFDEEETEEELKKKQSKKTFARLIGAGIALLLIMQVANIWFDLFSLDNRELARTSEELRQQEHIAEFMEAVVTIQGNGGRGTGFAISEDGYIITNHHVVHNREPLAVVFPNNDIYQADIIQSEEELDVALLKIDGDELPYLPLRLEDAKEQEKIYVIGSPLSQTQIVNEGEILNDETPFQVLKISNAIFPGHSGSPVLSEHGEVVGVVYARSRPSIGSEEEGHGLAIPIEQILATITDIESVATNASR